MHALTLASQAGYMVAGGEGKVQVLPEVHHNPKEEALRRVLLLVGLVMLGALLASGIALAAPKVGVSGLRCDAPGDDNQARNLNKEFVVFRNNTNAPVRMKGWTVHDEGRIHTYRFPNFTLGAGKSVTLHSGRGSNSRRDLYWQRSYGAVWNNTGDTATLRNRAGKA